MTTDRETLRVIGSWLEEGRTRLPDHVLDRVLDQLPATPQRRPRRSARRIVDMNPVVRYAIAAAAVVVIAVVGFNVLGATSRSEVGNRSPSPVVSPSPSRPTEPRGSLPVLGLPGTRASPAGEYGWQGGYGSRAFVHKEAGATGLIFEVGAGCLNDGEAQDATPVRIAGYDGVSVEPYDRPSKFGTADDQVVRAHALAVGSQTLCVFVTWHATTTDDERDAVLQVLDTLRVEPIGEHSIRVVFTLDDGWDTG